MEISELIAYREEILDTTRDQDGFVHQEPVLEEILPYLLDAKLIDSEDIANCYFSPRFDALKLNAYTVNESKERLQLFIIDESTIDESLSDSNISVSLRSDYEKQFKRVSKLLDLSFKGTLQDKIQDSDGAIKSLLIKLNSTEGKKQFDVIEIFLISLTATVSNRGETTQPRHIHFDDQNIEVKYEEDGEKHAKTMLLLRKVIDLNFIATIIQSRGNREPLTVNFANDTGAPIRVIEAANEANFQSFLCVLNAQIISDLYKRYSSRLLEKNVRSFLQFRGVNKGIKETIRDNPEQFVAYNNGLTITATKSETRLHKKHLYLDSLTDFQIVNGGQTTASIYFSQKEGLDISKVNVMAKINVAKDITETELDDLISNISKFSNTQSNVTDVDLRSKSPQLRKLKSLSESVTTPSGTKWFFERAKGEFLTKVRHAGSRGKQLHKDFPKNKRFTNMELAKYYSSWGEYPWLVKKGGMKIFRHFIEIIEAKEDEKLIIKIDREFYENLVSKIILFRHMEKIYGQGKNALGQLRASVIPYTLGVIYFATDKQSKSKDFNLDKIWRDEGINEELNTYLKELMILVNTLIKELSASDDYNEYSKKPELWDAVSQSPKLKEFMGGANTVIALKKYLK